ncbi:hypothetical protein [Massilibacteroides sp.]|uniref:hypothetical protein n=1 Tax=Massilibacteroides sp. TaxID=2034766 RepID=UPI00260C4696|nr:hypothetical protein [Massilibacteroides sp.]MDD4515377.1 hypothetical protein [Massilibacteroides sp.]
MNKAAKKAADLAAKATGQTENHEANTPANVMKVLKPETEKKEPAPDPQPESQPKPKRILSISEIKMKAKEAQYLAEQHDNLLMQLEKLQQFAAEVGEEATLRLSSDGLKSFSSKDPQAVAQMVEICTSNIQRRIENVEQKLTA